MRQIVAGHQLHRERVDVTRLLEPEDLRDVGVIQGGQCLGFALESRDPFRVSRKRLGKDLDGDVAIQLRVAAR